MMDTLRMIWWYLKSEEGKLGNRWDRYFLMMWLAIMFVTIMRAIHGKVMT